MEATICELMTCGFMIYPSNGRFVVKKQAVPCSDTAISETEVATYEEAVELAKKLFAKPILKTWSVVVRYDRGLGVEYRKLHDVVSVGHQEAVVLAEKQVGLSFDNKTRIAEIKVRPKSRQQA
jgi:hypothetical protein